MDKNFEILGLRKELVEGLGKMSIVEPTEIQERAIEIALDGKDLVGESQTGTGKTLAYLLPIIEKIDVTKKEMQAIILAPTHELAIQIQNTIGELKSNTNIGVTSASLIGSGNINRQIDKLKTKPHILVGSTGRVLELIKKKKISAHTIKTLVIDEGDKLLDRKNIDTVKEIIKSVQKTTQIMVFSATIVKETISICNTFMKEPQIIRVKQENKVNENISHSYFITEHRDKIDTLRKIIHAEKMEKVLVFINNSYDVDVALSKLKFNKIKAESIHGEVKKEERQRALEGFRKGAIQVLIATDIGARGLDIKGITHIINLHMPEKSKEYIHRAGRVGRAGKKGIAYSLVDPKELPLINKYMKELRIEMNEKAVYEGKIFDLEDEN